MKRPAPSRDPESWARELPAPLAEPDVRAAVEALLTCRLGERRSLLHAHGPEARLQILVALIEEGYSYRHSQPRRYLEIAQLANQCAYRYLNPPAPLRPQARQVRAAALGFLANACRILGKFPEAEECWQRVGRMGDVPRRSPVLHARFLDLQASLARDRRHFRHSRALLLEAAGAYEALGLRHHRGRVELMLAKDRDDSGDPGGAIDHIFQALASLDARQEPGLVAIALQQLAAFLTDVGRLDEAVLVADVCSWMLAEVGEPVALLRLVWVKGRLLRELDLPREAAPLLEQVRTGLLAQGLTYDAALASLDLALVQARLSQFFDMAQLARAMYPVFAALDIPREASMALLSFAYAAENFCSEMETIVEAQTALLACRRQEVGE